MIVFDVIHQMCSITLHLLRRGDGTKHYLSETLAREHSKANAANRPPVFN